MAALVSVSTMVNPPALAHLAPNRHSPRDTSPATCPWTTSAQLSTWTPVQLAQEVLAQMTTDEKIAMLGLSANSALSISNETPAIARLCLPSLVLRDGPLGVGAGAQNTTAFPAQINLASSFDVALAQQYGAALGQEARLQGNMGIQGPGLDVAPFDNWGRLFENFGEDPLLTSSMGTAEVSGIQGQGTIAIAKHYGPYAAEDTRPVTNYTASNATLQQVYLAPFRAAIQSGLSGLMCSYGATDTTPNCANPFLMGEAAHWGFTGIARTDAGALKNDVAAVRDGVGLFKTLIAGQIPAALADGLLTIAQLNAAVATTLQVMFQYHDIPAPSGTSATPASTPQSLAVATRIAEEGSVLLKNDGTLPLSSTNASLGVIATTPSSNPLAQGLGSSFVVGTGTVTPLAGLQSAFGPSNVSYDAALPTFLPVSTGPATLINPRLRIYSAPVMIPLDTHGVVDFNVQTPSSAQLLRNGRTFFQTLRQTTNVGGDFAARAVRVGAGDSLTVQWVGTAPVLTYAPVNDVIAQAVAMARRVKVPIVMVGTRATEGNDMSSLALPGFQNQLVAAVAAANPRTVVVVNAGNPVLMPWLSKVAAVLDNWYPGQVDGAALSDLLDGVADPSGKLPIAFPTSDLWAPLIPSTWPYAVSAINLDKLGVNVGEHWYDVRHITPLFAFGFGLSYTSFALSNLSAVATTGGYNLTVQVSNTGPVSGRAVTEVYVSGPPRLEFGHQHFGYLHLDDPGHWSEHERDDVLARFCDGPMEQQLNARPTGYVHFERGPVVDRSVPLDASHGGIEFHHPVEGSVRVGYFETAEFTNLVADSHQEQWRLLPSDGIELSDVLGCQLERDAREILTKMFHR